jgi:tripartite-type tricarboxylate transporter receptor subunit TctC
MNRLLAVALTALCVPALTAWAQPYPSKPVRMVLPFATGGAADVRARIFTERLAQVIAQPVVLENRPGAGQNIGTAAVVKSPPDGYTLLLASEVILHEHLLDKEVPFVAPRDLVAVGRMAGSGTFVAVPATFPARTLREFVAEVKANPGKYNYATVNNFELPEWLLFRERLGLQMVSVPYKGGATALQAIATGEAHLLMAATQDYSTFGNRIRALAYTGRASHAMAASIPTVAAADVGLSDYDSVFAYSVFAPTGTPADVVSRLHGAIVQTMRSPDVEAKFRDLGLEVFTPGLAELAAIHAAKLKGVQDMLARGVKLR